MKRVYIYLLILCAVAAMIGCTRDMSGSEIEVTATTPTISEGVLFVKFTPEVADIIAENKAADSRTTRSGVGSVDRVLDIIEGYELERVFPIDAEREACTRREGLDRWYVVRYASSMSPTDVAASLSQLGEVSAIDFNRYIKRAYSTKATPLSVERVKRIAATRSGGAMNDPLLDLQWNIINRGDHFLKDGVCKSRVGADVQCAEAWSRSTGDGSVVVAVLDEGVCITHPDLAKNIWVNSDESEGVDDDNNGYVGDLHGYNFVYDTGQITWNNYLDSGHGTHVAGVISAVNNNGEGVSSIAGGDGSGNGVKIMVCQIFSGNMATSILSTVRAIKYAADNGAVVLQCSWGYVSGVANAIDWGAPGFASEEEWVAGSPLEKAALDYFTHNAGSPNGPLDGGVAVFAGGNESAAMAGYPGAHDDYLAVAATAADFTPAVYTNYGPGTKISAPGGDQDYYYDYVDDEHNYGEVGCILSTLPSHIAKSGYGYMEGTSMACPHVSGVVALAVSYAAQLRRTLRAEELRELVCSTARNIDGFMKGAKTYCRYVADIGPLQPMQMTLSNYVGQMGAGQIDATALLAAIADGEVGRDRLFPNIYIACGDRIAVAPALYFKEGDGLSFEVAIEDKAVATATLAGSDIIFEGLKVGATSGVVRASNGAEQRFTITVRERVNSNGWL